MKELKTLFKYVLMIVGFFILTEFLIQVGLNTKYEDIKRIDNISQVNIYQAEATLVNGRIRGIITNTEAEDLSNKYVRIDFYSERNVLLGRKYIEINNLQANESQAFEVFFKLEDVSSYEVVITDHKEPEQEIEFIPKDLTKGEIIVGTVLTFLIFW